MVELIKRSVFSIRAFRLISDGCSAEMCLRHCIALLKKAPCIVSVGYIMLSHIKSTLSFVSFCLRRWCCCFYWYCVCVLFSPVFVSVALLLDECIVVVVNPRHNVFFFGLISYFQFKLFILSLLCIMCTRFHISDLSMIIFFSFF